MIRMPQALAASHLESKMLLQVHDELVFEVPTAEKEALIAVVKPIMEKVTYLTVPLTVGIGTGPNWEEAH